MFIQIHVLNQVGKDIAFGLMDIATYILIIVIAKLSLTRSTY